MRTTRLGAVLNELSVTGQTANHLLAMYRYLLPFAAIFALAACEEEPTGPVHVNCDPLLQTFGEASGDPVQVTDGVSYTTLQLGSGPVVQVGSLIEVNYSLYTTSSGTNALQTTCVTSSPVFPFVVGSGSVITGFDLGVRGMAEGGVRRVVLEPEAAYNDPSHPLFGEELVFYIQLVDVRTTS